MQSRLFMVLGAVWGVLFVVLGLWAWQRAPHIVSMLDPNRPELALWAVRCAAVGVIAGAQSVLLTCVVNVFYRRDVISDVMRISAAVVCTLCVVSAVALAVAGR